MATRALHTLTLPRTLPPGTTVWLTACWQNPRAECGPFAQPIYTHAPFRLTGPVKALAPEPIKLLKAA